LDEVILSSTAFFGQGLSLTAAFLSDVRV